jgi:ZIP family zinc transporter
MRRSHLVVLANGDTGWSGWAHHFPWPPVARLRLASRQYLSLLNAFAIGILLFLFIEVMEHAIAPVEEAIEEGESGFLFLLLIVGVGFAAGLLSLVYYAERFLRGDESMRRLAILIAVGIGLHNFSEGLAIGSSAQAGELALALTLVVGFALHNTTEGFGIAAPLADEKNVGWGFLAICGLIAGGPVFLGTVVGFSYTSEVLSILFLALAGGAIIYVVNELFGAGRKLGAPAWAGWGLTAGILLGFITEFILEAVGG